MRHDIRFWSTLQSYNLESVSVFYKKDHLMMQQPKEYERLFKIRWCNILLP